MTLEQAQSKIAEIQARTNIPEGQKSAMIKHVKSQYLRANPDADPADLG